MRNGTFNRTAGAKYSTLAQDEKDYVAPRRQKSAPPGSLRSYLDNLDNPDNLVFQRWFQTTINVALLWGVAFAYTFPELRMPIGAFFGACAGIAGILSHMG